MKRLLILSIVAFASACSRGPSENFNAGTEAIRSGEYALADSLFTLELQRKPGNAAALNNRAFARLRIGNIEAALADADSAIALKPGEALFYITRGEVHYHMGNTNAALADAERSVELDARNADAWYFLSSVRLVSADGTGAMNAVRKALDYAPGMLLARQQMVVIHIRMGRYDKAEYEAGKMVQEGHRDVQTLNNRGYARLMQDKYPEAIEDFNAALRIEPDNAKVLNNLGWALFRTGNTEEAMLHIHQAIEADSDNPEAWRNMALIYLDRGDTQNACVAFSELQKAMSIPGPPVYLSGAEEVDRLWKLHCL